MVTWLQVREKGSCTNSLGRLLLILPIADARNHDEICKLDGIDALITLLKAEDTHSGRYAAFALANIASNADYRFQV